MDFLYGLVALTAMLCLFIIALAVLETVVKVAARIMRWFDG